MRVVVRVWNVYEAGAGDYVGGGAEMKMEILCECGYGGTILTTRPAQLSSLVSWNLDKLGK